MATSKNRLLTFDVGDDEILFIGAHSPFGDRTIYEGMEPDEYALVPTSELVDENYPLAKVSEQELRVEDLKVVGSAEIVTDQDNRDVELRVDGEKIVRQGAAGVYGLLWIPLADV